MFSQLLGNASLRLFREKEHITPCHSPFLCFVMCQNASLSPACPRLWAESLAPQMMLALERAAQSSASMGLICTLHQWGCGSSGQAPCKQEHTAAGGSRLLPQDTSFSNVNPNSKPTQFKGHNHQRGPAMFLHSGRC